MELHGKTVVVTGGGSGIGRALCEACHAAGAKNVIVADTDRQAAVQVAAGIGGSAVLCDVAQEASVGSLVEKPSRNSDRSIFIARMRAWRSGSLRARAMRRQDPMNFGR
jgi:Short-chain dehydrogenase involved in D-alanine esterification of lipoteichoic acid and wall teichoic acid (D-alanine transfer protein)